MILGMGGGNAISAGFRVYLKDDFSRSATRIAGKTREMRNEISVLRDNLMGAKRMYTGLATVAAGASVGMVRLAMKGAEYGFKMTRVKAITRGTATEMKKLDKIAKDLAGRTIFRPDAIASAMNFGAMAGQNASTLMNTITPATYLAAATDTQLGGKGGSMDIQTNIMKGFGLSDDRMMEVADMLTAATLSANTNLVDMGRAIKYTAATAMDMGTSLKETTSMIMVLGNAGMQSSQAGTAVENMLRYFARAEGSFSTKAQAKAMGMLGYTKKDFMGKDGELKPFTEVFKMINAGGKGLSRHEKQSALEKLFGVRGKRAGSAISRLVDDYDRFVDVLENSQGMAAQVSGDMMNNLKGEWEKTISAWESFAAAWSAALFPVLKPLMQFGRWIIGIVTSIIDTKVLGTLIAGIALTASTLLAFRWAIKAASISLQLLAGPLASLRGMRQVGRTSIGQSVRGGWGGGMFGQGGEKTKFSQKRGMYYSYGGDAGPSARWHKKGVVPPGAGGMSRGLKMLPKIGRYLSIGARFLGRLLPFVGPLLLAISLLNSLFPNLGSTIKDLINGTDDNTRAISAQYDLFKGTGLIPSQNIMSAYGGKTTDTLVSDLTKGINALLAQGTEMSEISKMNAEDIIFAVSGIGTTVYAAPTTK